MSSLTLLLALFRAWWGVVVVFLVVIVAGCCMVAAVVVACSFGVTQTRFHTHERVHARRQSGAEQRDAVTKGGEL